MSNSTAPPNPSTSRKKKQFTTIALNKLTRTHYKYIQHHYITNTTSRNGQHRLPFIYCKSISPFLLNFTYCIKDTNMPGIIRNCDHIRQLYILCPLTKCFNVEESRPLLVPHKYIYTACRNPKHRIFS